MLASSHGPRMPLGLHFVGEYMSACLCLCVHVCVLVRTLCWAQEALQIAQVIGTVYELMCSSPFAPLTFALLKYF